MLENIESVGCPWIVGGEFNVILDEDEKLRDHDFT